MLNIFAIKKEERFLFIMMMILIASLNALLIYHYSPLFLKCGKVGYYTIFHENFRVSGYDYWSYLVLSNFRVHFETYRHPLFLSILYPLYWLNQWLISLTGMNCAIYIMATLSTVASTYAFIFMYRIFRDVMEIKRFDAYLLVFFFFSFGHIMLTTMVPDHFPLSMFLLTLTLYLAGVNLRNKSQWSFSQISFLLFLTTGVTVTNGVKTVMAALFVNGKKVFRLVNVIKLVVPLLLLFTIYKLQYNVVEVPQKIKTEKIEKNVLKKKGEKEIVHRNERDKWFREHWGKSWGDDPILRHSDATTSRTETIVENLFGESIQLHQNYALQDTSFTRPVFVPYRCWINYFLEGVIVLLFVIGVVFGFSHQFMRMLLAWFTFDIVLHLLFGFGINEIYIMTSGWAFIIPIAWGYMLSNLSRNRRFCLRVLTVAMSMFLLINNGLLIFDYFWKY